MNAGKKVPSIQPEKESPVKPSRDTELEELEELDEKQRTDAGPQTEKTDPGRQDDPPPTKPVKPSK